VNNLKEIYYSNSSGAVCICVAPDSCISVLGGNKTVAQNDGSGIIHPRIINVGIFSVN
jgi:hypothetical protein